MKSNSKNEECKEISKFGFDEVRRIYDSEEKRTSSLESKAIGILGFVTLIDTILLSIITYLLSVSQPPLYIEFLYLSLVGIIILSCSLVGILNVLLLKEMRTPFSYDSYEIYSNYTENELTLKENLFDKYRVTISQLYKINEKKALSLKISIIFLVVGFIFSVSALFMVFLYK